MHQAVNVLFWVFKNIKIQTHNLESDDTIGETMTTDVGFIAGVTVGAAIASAFLFACLYSAYRAVM